ncbi:MAG TPA: sterol desaturase family protein [Steroidobacteraceae bacterium]|nr:sterol desaturase family protein [Steroidobacteraceae bacterium]
MRDVDRAALAVFVGDLLRYLIGAGLVYLVLWKWMARRLARRRIASWPAAKQLRTEFAYSMLTVLVFASVGFWIQAHALTGGFKIYTDVNDYGWAYTMSSLLVLIIAHDAYFYWTHRALHTPWLFRHVHAVHHRSRNPSPWASYSFHPFEAVIQAAFLPLVLFLMPAHVVVLLIFVSHMMLRNALGHAGVEIYPRNALRHPVWRLLTSTTHHHLHHERASGNYGLYFSWWDKWFRTEQPDYEARFDAVTHRVST